MTPWLRSHLFPYREMSLRRPSVCPFDIRDATVTWIAEDSKRDGSGAVLARSRAAK